MRSGGEEAVQRGAVGVVRWGVPSWRVAGSVSCVEARGMVGVGNGVSLLLRVSAVVLSLLLLAGDVERNPGPTDKEVSHQVEKVLHSVDDSPLGEDDLFDILEEVMPAVALWKAIGEGLRLNPGKLDEIEAVHNRSLRDCMSAMLKHWLRKNYNVERFGEPTWKTVVKVMANSAAGNNCGLALIIAGNHSVQTSVKTSISTSVGSQDFCATNTVTDEGASVSPRPSSSTQSEGSQKPPFGIAAATPQPSMKTPPQLSEHLCASSTLSGDVFTFEGTSVSPRPSSSTLNEGSQKPPFGCGCGKCTFFSFIESRCPNPIPSASSFPYLDLSGLAPEQQQTLAGRLRFESKDIMLKFQHVVSVALKSLTKRGVMVRDLVSHLMTLGTFEPVYEESKMPLLQNCYKDLMNAETIPDVFLQLRDYFSFFNYHIIEHIITELGTEEDKQELEKYKDEFQLYAKRRIYECLPQFGPVSETDHADIFVKVDSHYESYTLVQLQDFQNKLSELFHISSQGILRLCRVEKGCFQLMFQVPSFMQNKIFPLCSEQEMALVAEGVIKLTCGNYEFVAKGDEDETDTELKGQMFQLPLTRKDFDADSAMGVSTGTFSTDEEDHLCKEIECTLQNNESQQLPSEASSEYHRTELHRAAKRGDLETVRFLTAEKHQSLLHTDKDGDTALHAAAMGGSLDVLKYFIGEKNCKPACPGYHMRTPLHNASDAGHLDVVKYLVNEQQVDPLCKDEDGTTPLHLSCASGDLNIVTFLTEVIEKHNPVKDILADLKDRFENNPLHYAARRGHLNIVQFFISEKNCSPNIPGDYGRSPLHYAAETGQLEIVKYLTDEEGCDPSCLDTNEETPLHLAARYGRLLVVEFLTLQKHCNPASINSSGATPVHWAAACGHLEVLKFFVKQNCSPNMPDSNGRSPLHYAAEAGQLHIMKYSINEQGCDPSCLDSNKVTPLHSAANNGHLEIVKFLTGEQHCNPNQQTNFRNNPPTENQNLTPYQYAKVMGHSSVVLYLQEF